MIECVPNFSEGQDRAVVDRIASAIASAPGVGVLGWEADADHHRSVVTFAGEAEAVLEGALRGVGEAANLIDLRKHQGIHPRVGACDVLPFIPLSGGWMEDCIMLAHRAGREIWLRYGIPVYFYEGAARLESRRFLQNVRRDGFDGHPPDVGTYDTHPTAGAVCVGARQFLIAYNVELASGDVAVAQAIARKIRASSGGIPFVKALGLLLSSRNIAQVSMNLTNFPETDLDGLLAAIEREAAVLGTRVTGCELIGFVPQAAYKQAPCFFERARDFSPARIIEKRIAQLG